MIDSEKCFLLGTLAPIRLPQTFEENSLSQDHLPHRHVQEGPHLKGLTTVLVLIRVNTWDLDKAVDILGRLAPSNANSALTFDVSWICPIMEP
jgi:hypothetical protein